MRTLALPPVVILAFASGVRAQTSPPSTDIYLLELRTTQNGVELGAAINVTDRDGYDNQPFFSPDGKTFLYTSRRDDQNDIYRYDVASRKTSRVTETKESEYSPTVMPDGSHFSVIRVESDGVQRLWKFELSGQMPALVLENVKPVGYHAWVDETTLVLFVLGSPPTLQISSTVSGKAEVLLTSVGRSLHKLPGKREVSFVHKVSEKEWWIKVLDPTTRQVRPVVQTLPGSEDYTWTPDGTLLMAQGSKVFALRPPQADAWKEVADLASQGIEGVTRLAVSSGGNLLALVGNRPAR